MGRKFKAGRTFADADKSMNDEYSAETDKLNAQWDDLNKLVSIYDLNNGESFLEDTTQAEPIRERKRPPLRNSGEGSKGIRLTDIQKEVKKLTTSRDRKRFQQQQKLLNNVNVTNGVDSLGPPSKRVRNGLNESLESNGPTPKVNGRGLSTSSNESFNQSSTFIELDQLKAGPVASINHFEEDTTDYYVTVPLNKDVECVEEVEGEESDESYGIDLMEESEGEFEEESEAGESLEGFIDDIEENEVSEDKLEQELEEESSSKRQKRKASVNLVEDYDSASDEEFVETDESNLDESEGESLQEEGESGVSSNEIDDLLRDITGSDGEMFDSDDEERIMHLDPVGLKLKSMNLSIDGYNVDETVLKVVKIKRDKKTEDVPEMLSYQLFCFSVEDEHSVYTAIKAFKWLIFPLGIQEFFEGVYSKKAMVVRRSNSDYYNGVFPTSAFYNIFRQNFIEYGVNINVAKYTNGLRTTHNPEGRAYAGAIHSFIQQGMSVQCVNPQTFDKNIHYICDVLQEIFNCFVGANCYYTPKGSAGFAPHFDDIDAFIIQTKGQKHWKIYAPSDSDELWPLQSSHNFSIEEMEAREDDLVFDGVLKAGDILYMPRGFIHCAKTSSKHDSLHVTISVAQNHAYCNLLEKVTVKLLEAKTEEIAQLRKNLPINILDIQGVANTNYENDACFDKSLQIPISLYLEQFQIGLSAAIPAAIDDIGRDFMKKALPPLLSDHEKLHSIHGLNGQLPDDVLFTKHTQLRFIRKHTQRLLFESEDTAFLIHRMENSMIHEGRPEVTVNVPKESIGSIETLLKAYPEWQSVGKLGNDMENNIEVAQFLYNTGLLMARAPPIPQLSKASAIKKLSTKQSPIRPFKESSKVSPIKKNKKKKHSKHQK